MAGNFFKLMYVQRLSPQHEVILVSTDFGDLLAVGLTTSYAQRLSLVQSNMCYLHITS